MDGSNFRIDAALSALVVDLAAGMSGEFAADLLAPRVPVGRTSGKFWQWGLDSLRRKDTTRAPGELGAVNARTGEWVSYSTEQWSDTVPITDEERAEASDNVDLDLKQEALGEALFTLLLDREARMAAVVANDANFRNVTTLAGNDQWNSGHADSNPIEDIKDALVALAPVRPSHIGIPYEVQLELLTHSTVQELVKYTHADLLTNIGFPKTFLGMTVVTMDAVHTTAVKGDSLDDHVTGLTPLYSDNVILWKQGNPALNRKAFCWTKTLSYKRAQNVIVETWDDKPTLTTFVRARDPGSKITVVSPYAAVKIADVLA